MANKYWIRVASPYGGPATHWYTNRRVWVRVRRELKRIGAWYAAGRGVRRA